MGVIIANTVSSKCPLSSDFRSAIKSCSKINKWLQRRWTYNAAWSQVFAVRHYAEHSMMYDTAILSASPPVVFIRASKSLNILAEYFYCLWKPEAHKFGDYIACMYWLWNSANRLIEISRECLWVFTCYFRCRHNDKPRSDSMTDILRCVSFTSHSSTRLYIRPAHSDRRHTNTLVFVRLQQLMRSSTTFKHSMKTSIV